MFVIELYNLAVGILAVLNFCFGVYLWINSKQMPGARIGSLFVLAVGQICMMFYLQMLAPTPADAFLFTRLRFLGISLLNPLTLIFMLQYTRQTHLLRSRRYVLLLFVVPVITQLTVWIPEFSQYFFVEWRVHAVNGMWVEQRRLAGWFYVHFFYNAVLMGLTLGILFWYTRRIDSSRSRDLYILTVILVACSVAGWTSVTFSPNAELNMIPVVTGLCAPLLSWLLILGRIDRVMPVAYDVVFYSIVDPVIVVAPSGRIVKVNPAAGKLFGKAPAQFINVPLDDVMRHMDGWGANASGGVSVFTLYTGTGDARLIYEARRLPLQRELWSIGSLLVLRDVTSQQKALELAIEQQRAQVIANFISDVSHEFRTPLSIIKSSAYLLGKHTPSMVTTRHVDKINEHVDRINALVNDLQVMATLDSNQPIDREPTDLTHMLRMIIEGYARPMAAARSQHVTLDIEAGVPVVMCDQDELKLAIEKILHNAIRYTPAGGSIGMTLAPYETGAQIEIRDSGVGMDDATAQAALKRLYRLDASRSSAGFGLGLPIAQKIMERHGGSLRMTSEPDAGTVVTLLLP